jgi:hypothetical protein
LWRENQLSTHFQLSAHLKTLYTAGRGGRAGDDEVVWGGGMVNGRGRRLQRWRQVRKTKIQRNREMSKMEEFNATISPFTFKSLSSRAASMAKRMRLL